MTKYFKFNRNLGELGLNAEHIIIMADSLKEACIKFCDDYEMFFPVGFEVTEYYPASFDIPPYNQPMTAN